MKNSAKKLLAIALVLVMILIPVAIPVSAATDDVTLLYKVNFNGDANMDQLKEGWDGDFKIKPSEDGSSVELKIGGGSKWSNAGAQLKGLNIQNGAYTLMFTVTASDDNEEIGLLPDHQTGFVVNPGQNTFRYTDHLNDTTPIATTAYEGTGELTQTYAIELAGEGTGSTNGQPNVTITTYKLYNLTYDATGKAVWKLACGLTADQLDAFFFDWGAAGDCDANVYARFSRDRKSYEDANNGTITVSDFRVYDGLVATKLNSYESAKDGDLLYTVNFKGDDVFQGVGESWSGMPTREVSGDGASVTLKPHSNKTESSAFGGYLDTDHYPAKGNSYTMVFTVTASDADQEIGLYPDWSSGFVVAPGKDSFKYVKTEKDGSGKRTVNNVIVDYTEYEGEKALTQTYAIEYTVNGSFDATEYNLYVAQDGSWKLLYSLEADELEAGPNWSTGDFETVIRFCRDPKIANQSAGTVTVSDFNVYKGLAAKSGAAAAPNETPVDPEPENPGTEEPPVGGDDNEDENEGVKLPYTVNFKGDEVFSGAKSAWSGAVVKTTETSATMSTKSDSNNASRGSVWGADLKGLNILNNSYTMVFTLDASDSNEEIGFLLCDWAGFVIIPGQNTYRFITTKFEDSGTDGAYERVIQRGTYGGTKSLTQTYAIELATSGTTDEGGASVDAYNLYVAQNGEWVLVCSLTDIDESIFDWFYFDGGVYEEDFTMRLYRRCYITDQDGWTTSSLDTDQDGTVTVSDVTVYQGLVATENQIDAPDTPVTPVNPGGDNTDDDDNDNENTGNENTGNENTGNEDNKNDQTDTTEKTETTNKPNKNDTPKDTTATTEPATDAVTDGETDTAEVETLFGCGGTISIGGAVLLLALSGAMGMTFKKKED